MPLTPGAPVGQSIEELINSFKSKGKIGNTKPKNPDQARRIAIAIAYKNKGEGPKI